MAWTQGVWRVPQRRSRYVLCMARGEPLFLTYPKGTWLITRDEGMADRSFSR